MKEQKETKKKVRIRKLEPLKTSGPMTIAACEQV